MERWHQMAKRYLPYLIVGVVAAVIGGLIVARLLVGQDMIAGNEPPVLAETATSGTPGTFADVAEKVAPGVVKIETVMQPTIDSRDNPFYNDPFFRRFFHDFTVPRGGLGSGFIFDERGYILTNEHVIRGASKIMVTIKDYDKPIEAQVVGSDFELDLAVIKIKPPEGKKLPVLALGDSSKMRVGDWVVAIGDPYGQDWTVTAGIISAKGRPLTIEEDDGSGKVRQYRDLIQTDAAINPGNSGGPLVNLKGEVIGINTAINAAAQGIGFAIPINTAKEVLKDLIEKGGVPHPWLGITMVKLTPELAKEYELPIKEGVIIRDVFLRSPAYKAGLRTYDVILEYDGVKINDPDQLRSLVQKTPIGKKVNLLIYRAGQKLTITVEIGQAPND